MTFSKPKRITILAVILALLLAVLFDGFLYFKKKSSFAYIAGQINSLVSNNNADDINADPDQDGLKNWEEELYHTNAKNSDSDNDGYLDGEEVATGYDPTKKAPGDEMANANTQKPRPLPNNLTKALSKSLSQAIVEGKIKSLNSTTKEPLTAEELKNEPALDEVIGQSLDQQIQEFIIPQIPDSEIKISSAIGEKPTADYLVNLGQSLRQVPKNSSSEMQLFLDAIQTRDFAKVQQMRQAYERSYQDLKNITVPANFVSLHKSLLGIFWVTKNIYKAVENIDQDPLKTTIAIRQYRQIIERTKTFAAELIKEELKY